MSLSPPKYYKNITLLTKIHLVKAMVILVVMHRCASWSINIAAHRRIDAVELCCWRRLLSIHWTARRSKQSLRRENQSWILIGKTEAETETQILWPPDVKSWFLGKDPDAGKDWRQEEKVGLEWDGWMASPTQWTRVSVNSGSWWWPGKPALL